MKKLLIFVATLLMVKGLGGAWTVETVATLSDTCRGLGLALDSNNNPHIVYAERRTDSANVQEKYKDAGGTWQGPYSINCPHSENMAPYGPWNCVAFDAQNDTFWVITLYGYDYTSYLCASYKDGINGAWTSGVQVKSHYGTWPARFTAGDVTVESGRLVHLVYTDFNDMTIYYKKRTAGGWGSDEQVGTAGDMYACWYYYSLSIALEGTTPHVAGYFYNDDPTYYDVLPSYRNKSGGSWGTRIRMSNWAWWPNKGGGYVSLALNPLGNGYDWACWGDPENTRRVRYGQRSASGWTETSPVTPGDMGIGDFCADIVGHAGMVFLAYRDNSGDLKFARYEVMGPPTSTQTIDAIPTDVSYVCLKIAPNDNIHIAYSAIESGSYKIKYAYNSSIGIEEAHSRFQSMGIEVYPNPFSERIEIRLQMTDNRLQITDSRWQLKIYDATGRLVKDFSNQLSAVSHRSSVIWSGDDNSGNKVQNGVYFITMTNVTGQGLPEPGQVNLTKKIVVIR